MQLRVVGSDVVIGNDVGNGRIKADAPTAVFRRKTFGDQPTQSNAWQGQCSTSISSTGNLFLAGYELSTRTW